MPTLPVHTWSAYVSCCLTDQPSHPIIQAWLVLPADLMHAWHSYMHTRVPSVVLLKIECVRLVQRLPGRQVMLTWMQSSLHRTKHQASRLSPHHSSQMLSSRLHQPRPQTASLQDLCCASGLPGYAGSAARWSSNWRPSLLRRTLPHSASRWCGPAAPPVVHIMLQAHSAAQPGGAAAEGPHSRGGTCCTALQDGAPVHAALSSTLTGSTAAYVCVSQQSAAPAAQPGEAAA